MMTKTLFILGTLGTLAALPAMASTITFTISATGSGTLDGVAFSDKTITFTEVTNTSDISDATTECTFSYPCAPDQPDNTVTIGGVGTETITGDTYFFDNSTNLVGIAYEPYQTYLSAEGSPFSSYGLTTAFAPAAYTAYTVGSSDLATSGGALDITSFSGEATFSAVVGTSAIPEPGSLGLVLAGAIPLAAVLLRRRKQSVR